MNPYMSVVADDPEPFITETFERYGAFEREDREVMGQTVNMPTVKAMAAVLGAATAVVNALSTSEDTFVVRFSPTTVTASSGETGMGESKERVVVIGVRHWLDEDLTDAQRAVITIGLAFHEVGHVRWSMGWLDRLKKKYGSDRLRMYWAKQALNLSHDIMLEHLQPLDYPGFAGTLEPKNRYFSVPFTASDESTQDRYDTLMLALKFPWSLIGSPPTEAAAFAERMKSRKALDTRTQNGIIEDILTYLGDLDDEGGEGDEGGEESEEGEDTEEGEGKGEGEPNDGDEPGEGKDDGESEDGDGEGEGSGDGDDTDDTDDRFGEPTSEPEGPPKDAKDDGEPAESDESSEGGGGERPSLHPQPDEADAEWQQNVDDFNAAQVKGRDLVLTGGGSFHKRELRIHRLGGDK